MDLNINSVPNSTVESKMEETTNCQAEGKSPNTAKYLPMFSPWEDTS